MAQKLLVGDKDCVLLIPAFEIAGVPQLALPSSATAEPISDVTAALLNYYIPIVTPGDAGSHWGGNVTCSVVSDWKLALKDSSTKDIRTLCSVGTSTELTYYNYDGQFNFLRDIDPADATSEFNLAANLTMAPDIPYVIAHRIGYASDAAAAVGQEWHFYYFWTDLNVPSSADDDYEEIGQTFVPKGIINFKYELAA